MELSIHSVKSDHSAEMGYDYGTYKAGSASDAEVGEVCTGVQESERHMAYCSGFGDAGGKSRRDAPLNRCWK